MGRACPQLRLWRAAAPRQVGTSIACLTGAWDLHVKAAGACSFEPGQQVFTTYGRFDDLILLGAAQRVLPHTGRVLLGGSQDVRSQHVCCRAA